MDPLKYEWSYFLSKFRLNRGAFLLEFGAICHRVKSRLKNMKISALSAVFRIEFRILIEPIQ